MSLANKLFKASYKASAVRFVASGAFGKHSLRQQEATSTSVALWGRVEKESGQLGRKDRLRSVYQ